MLYLDRKYAEEMVTHALEDDPNECCGILAGSDGEVHNLYRMVNVEASPYRYRMDPKELLNVYREIDDRGWEIIAIYHSHTHSEAYPSRHRREARHVAGGVLHPHLTPPAGQPSHSGLPDRGGRCH